MVKLPKLISSPPDKFFWEGYEFRGGLGDVEYTGIPFTHISITDAIGRQGMVGNWLIIWIEHSLFNFYTLGITVTVKSHWFPQLLPVIY